MPSRTFERRFDPKQRTFAPDSIGRAIRHTRFNIRPSLTFRSVLRGFELSRYRGLQALATQSNRVKSEALGVKSSCRMPRFSLHPAPRFHDDVGRLVHIQPGGRPRDN